MNLKSFVFAAFLALFAMPVSAQNSDDFFSVGDEYGGTRDAITYWTATNGIGNNGIGQSEAPVGSGLLILTAVGAGYAIYRRKHNFKNGTTLLLAFALLLGMTQCKKNVETINPVGNGLHITLRVDGGSRANVTPGDEFATVTFEEGDVIYVGYNNACIGSLAYDAGEEKFGGYVAFVPQVGDEPLYFYFLGNKTPTITETTKYTVDIIDQTSKYPVISYNHSNEVYTGAGEYTANLFNYCSFMKFTTDNVTDINSQVLCITGMNNTVTVDFNGNTIEYGSKDDGLIKMPTSGSNVRWAIVLPQDAIGAGASGSVYTADEYYKGSRPAIEAIARNTYYKNGENLSMERQGFDLANESYVGTANTIAHIYQSNNGTATSNTITIANGQKVYLHGVNMLASGNAINCLGNAEIVLCGTNTINSQYSASGDNNKAIIKAGTYEPMTTLTISGSGSLEVRTKYTGSWMGAFIGSDKNGECGNISITGGAITAIAYPKQGASEYNNSSAYGAIIGAGSAYSGTSRCGDITISGGTITVDTHKGNGTGIGSGMSESSSGYSTCGTITISGGKVTATSNGGGAAIGSGASSIYLQNPSYNGYSKCDGIVITGANTVVNAYSKPNSGSNDFAGAAIGSGNAGEVVGGITISGGTVTATTTNSAPGIGAGKYRSNCGNILINGGTVEAKGGSNAAGIGTSKGLYKCVSTCGTITITNGVTKVKATKGTSGTKTIGKGYSSNSTCGTVTVGGTEYSFGINDSPYTYQP